MDPSGYYYDQNQANYGSGYYQEGQYANQDYMYYGYDVAPQQYWDGRNRGHSGRGRGRGRGQGQSYGGNGDPEAQAYHVPYENAEFHNGDIGSYPYPATATPGGQKPIQKSTSRRSYQNQRAERLDAREMRQKQTRNNLEGDTFEENSMPDASRGVLSESSSDAGKSKKETEKTVVVRPKSVANTRGSSRRGSDRQETASGKFGKSNQKENMQDAKSNFKEMDKNDRINEKYYESDGSRIRGGRSRGGRNSSAQGKRDRDTIQQQTNQEHDRGLKQDIVKDRRDGYRGRGYKNERSGYRDVGARVSPRDNYVQNDSEKVKDSRKKFPVSDDVRISGTSRGAEKGSRKVLEPGNWKGLRDAEKKNSGGNYKGRQFNLGGQKVTAEELETQRGSLIEQLCNNNYECMVCYDVIYREAAVWTCKGCYHIYHLKCIRKWASSPAAVVEGEDDGWRCPACQNVSHKFPGQYWCFCGKIREPLYNRYETPHSCGEMCGKKRDNNCPHPCNILCHPGPCPSCSANVVKECDCKGTRQSTKCSQSLSLKCEVVCDKPLNCGNHNCAQVCHAGKCSKCDIEIKQTCHCGQKERVVFCGTEESLYSSYTCEQVCNKVLDCGNHRCEKTCHDDTCDVCQLHPDVVSHCPCGATELSTMTEAKLRSSCIDPIPTCDRVCGKELPCGPEAKRHVCASLCHEGECSPCSGEMPVTCRCGFFIKEVPCKEGVLYTDDNPLLCDKRCNKKRQCGRHKCNQLCCVEKEHKCEQICGRKLTCGLHRCDEPCHRGNCHTCWEVSFEELHCHCGTMSIFPPVQCGTRPPECQQICRRSQPCEHPVHHTCHSEEACPPCTILTQKWCQGGHELRKNIPCHITDVSCGLPCNRALPCVLHKCQRTCHKGPCFEEGEKCKLKCPIRRQECGHPCGAPCHVGIPCPSLPCRTEVDMKCPCGHRTGKALCNLGGTSSKDTAQDYPKLSSSVLAGRIFGSQSIDIMKLNKTVHRELECNEECHRLERNKRLALALQISNPDVSSKLGPPIYPQFLKDFAKLNPAFVANVEKALSDLVQNAKDSKQTSRSHSFKAMKQQQRRLVHELAEYYGCQTQSYDYEPNKAVVATAYRDKCWLPSATLTKVVQREVHPLAPRPIPLNSTEKEIRAAVRASSKHSLDFLSSSVSQEDISKTKRVEKPFIDYFEMTD